MGDSVRRLRTVWVVMCGAVFTLLTAGACGSDSRVTPTTTTPPPAIHQVVPSIGLATEHTSISITGSGFQPGATVRVGGAVVAATFHSTSRIDAAAPPHELGEVPVIVTNPDGRATSLMRGFTYVPRPPAGSHRVLWSAGDVCPVIPPEARRRTYEATIEGGVVTLLTGTFLDGPICTEGSGLGCNQFRLEQSGDDVRVSIINPDEWHGGQIVERVETGGWLELAGTGTGRVHGTTIRATVDAHLWYCPGNPGVPFPCKAFVGCRVPQLELTISSSQVSSRR